MRRILGLVVVLALLSAAVGGAVEAAGGSLSINKQLALHESPGSSNFTKDFKLSLTPTPTEVVTISFTTNNQCQLRHADQSFTNGGAVVSDGGDVFDFSVRAVDDQLKEGDHNCSLSFVTSSSDSNYDGAELAVVVPITDDGDSQFVPAFEIIKISGDQLKEGSQQLFIYRIEANAKLEDPVTIQAFGGSNCEMIVNSARHDSAELTIAAGKSSTANFSVSARQDDVFEGAHSCIVTHIADTIDPQFSGVSVSPLVIPVTDDDQSDAQIRADQQDQDELERLAAGGGIVDLFDSNNDGVPDSRQEFVQSFDNRVSGSRQAIEVVGCSIDGSIVSLAEQSATPDRSLHFPYGVLAFNLECQPGGSAEVNWILDQLYPSDYPWQLRKVSTGGEVSSLSGAVFTQRELQNGVVTVVTYTVIDGGVGDEDGEVNGVIVDPVGLGLPLASLGGSATLARLDSSNWYSSPGFLLGAVALVGAIYSLSRPKVRAKLRGMIDGPQTRKPRIDKY